MVVLKAPSGGRELQLPSYAVFLLAIGHGELQCEWARRRHVEALERVPSVIGSAALLSRRDRISQFIEALDWTDAIAVSIYSSPSPPKLQNETKASQSGNASQMGEHFVLFAFTNACIRFCVASPLLDVGLIVGKEEASRARKRQASQTTHASTLLRVTDNTYA